MRLLEFLGLGLLLTAVVIGLLSMWLNSASGQGVALRFARLVVLLHTRALMLLVMLSGIGLLLAGVFLPTRSAPSAAPATTPSTSQPLPARPAPSAAVDLPAKPAPEPVVRPAVPTASTAAAPAGAEKERPAQPPAARPVKPASSMSAHAASRPAASPRAKPALLDAVPQKKNIFSVRCTRLLEKVGAGEPMTPQEQHEMVSKCQ